MDVIRHKRHQWMEYTFIFICKTRNNEVDLQSWSLTNLCSYPFCLLHSIKRKGDATLSSELTKSATVKLVYCSMGGILQGGSCWLGIGLGLILSVGLPGSTPYCFWIFTQHSDTPTAGTRMTSLSLSSFCAFNFISTLFRYFPFLNVSVCPVHLYMNPL